MTKALVIVAHPDDETIWMGGTILRNSKWDWTIISLCRKKDLDRMPKFQKVCKFYGSKSIISDLDDEKLEPLSVKEVRLKILSVLPSDKYDYVYTHGENGEYGHMRHKETHMAVKSLVQEKKLNTKKVFYFSYEPSEEFVPGDPSLKLALPKKEKDLITLTDQELFMKKKIITNIYGFSENSFEALSCNRVEAFL